MRFIHSDISLNLLAYTYTQALARETGLRLKRSSVERCTDQMLQSML